MPCTIANTIRTPPIDDGQLLNKPIKTKIIVIGRVIERMFLVFSF
jgi:hypothetical protein